MAETKMTPQEVATFWFKKCSELEAKLKDTEEYWSRHSADLQNKLNESKVLTDEFARELAMCKTKATEQIAIAQENVNRLNANYDNLVNNSFGMTYEQIIDLKCENARLREENTKFEKWQRLLDKIKIF
jgi:predicted nuclease with TOPRIM domain